MEGKESKIVKADVIRRGLTTKEKNLLTKEKTKKRFIQIVTGLMIWCLLSTTQITFVQSIQNPVKQNIQPSSFLSEKDLPILKRALKNINNEQYRLLTQQIITIIEKKGTITENDLIKLTNGTNTCINICCRVQTLQGGGPKGVLSEGNAWCIPGGIRLIFGLLFFGCVLNWNRSPGTSGYVQVGNEQYTSTGLEIGYYGSAYSGYFQIGRGRLIHVFSLNGYALLTFVQNIK